MKAEKFVEHLKNIGIESLIGVPDSTLKQFCDYINTDGKDELKHYVPANEGAAVGIATGVFLATGKPACVYMQNSGLGNTVNPVTSIANEEVYDIPMLFLVGWRGEPGVHDEPQHKFMGRITEKMFDTLEIEHTVISKDTTEEELDKIMATANKVLASNKQYAIIIKKETFEKRNGGSYANQYPFVREDAIATILKKLDPSDVVVSTTGKISREVYEEADIVNGQHMQEFLTVGGMGHASMITLGIADNMQDKKVFCIDGDGAVLMQMGCLAFVGTRQPKNMVHICINNDAHESVGGMPTGAVGTDYAKVATACGYPNVYSATSEEELEKALEAAKAADSTVFIEVKVALSSRADLGRPKETAIENKNNFMKYHGVIK